MQLSRRDAMLALSAAGVGSLAGCGAPVASDGPGDGTTTDNDDATDDENGGAGGDAVGDHELSTLIAVAHAVYPSAVDGVDEFVRTYTGGRVDGDGAYARGVAEAVETLDDYTENLYGVRYADLGDEERAEALDVMSVDVVDPDPDGTDPQRVRHYLVNELLYALYASPTGASLAGLENPPGHPGGTRSYQEGPDR
ncbi:gluconate 2-dehydrogenase subunit 3 family protein [Halobaculum magnesiiphilum]|uniref:Gluconate 2-dehydrogenase subunit 3 family protein n=1 Tax=Halobaculum magnesiiphilum TaxID=1017351 RepID=A0A8T8WIY7_9EURY|nr:gluconate 2-dehydrogenase subunit 3 family protein [Halobaculum magnesiiphilum]QZP39683.1 gluconate 2-dehydrogenase subunit 3 family protein [Halobaculum magnesiiphilum]